MLTSLFDRLTDFQLIEDDDTKIVGMPFRSPTHLPVTFRPRRMRSRAAILHDMGQQWSVEEFDLDPPRAGEVLVEMAAAGLCHSDEHIRNGDMSASNEVMEAYGLPSMFPLIGGHEGAGVVVEVGEGVTLRARRPRRDRPSSRSAALPLVQLRHGVHLRYGRAGA